MNFPRIGSGTQACAACKYQRRKCAPDCVLAPYFPPDHQRQFLHAHKLFGVSNILKIIRNLDPLEKDRAMQTMIYQADVRANDPVGGCYRIIRDLQHQIEMHTAELELVQRQIAICRAQAQQQIQIQDVTAALHGHTINSQQQTISADPPPQLHLSRLQQSNHQQQQLRYLHHQDNHHYEQGFNNQWELHDPGGGAAATLEPSSSPSLHNQAFVSSSPPPLLLHDRQIYEASACSSPLHLKPSSSSPLHNQFFVSSSPPLLIHDKEASFASSPLNIKQSFGVECDDIKPLLGIFEGQEESIISSERAVLKEESDSNQPVQEQDLKGAASLFSLTNCNS